MKIRATWPVSYEFACHSRACAPPPVGRGGSAKGLSTRATNSKALRDLSQPDSGFTLSSKLVPLRSGFAVAIGGSDRLLVAADAFKDGKPSKALVRLVRDRIDAALLTSPPKGTKVALGGWHNPADGKIEINITVVFPKSKEAQAHEYARRNDQIAMFSLHEGRVIDTGGSGGKRETG